MVGGRRKLAASALVAGATLAVAADVAAAGERPILMPLPAPLVAKAPQQLARGGMSVLPEYRIVAFDGAPQSPELGPLGMGTPRQAGRKLKRQASPYRRLYDKPVYPAFHLIATIATAAAGTRGLYRVRQSHRTIGSYFRDAKRRRFLLLLDIQSGRSKFIDEVRHLKPWLERRDVGIALDPEWNMGGDAIPGERIGHTTAEQVNEVSRFIARIVRRESLPEKVLVVHQFTPDMIRHRERLRVRDGVDLVLTADGFGTPAAKRAKFRELAPDPRTRLAPGLKLFYTEDTRLMTPDKVLRIRPKPRFVSYE